MWKIIIDSAVVMNVALSAKKVLGLIPRHGGWVKLQNLVVLYKCWHSSLFLIIWISIYIYIYTNTTACKLLEYLEGSFAFKCQVHFCTKGNLR